MECLSGYALKPSFDPAYSTAIAIANQEIKNLRIRLNDNYDIAQQHDVRYPIYRSPEQARIEELLAHIHKLKDDARKKSSSKAEKSGLKASKSNHKVKERAGRLKKFSIKASSVRPANSSASSPDSPISTKEAALKLLLKSQRGKNPVHRGFHLLCPKV